jgi:hypothetical protein
MNIDGQQDDNNLGNEGDYGNEDGDDG